MKRNTLLFGLLFGGIALVTVGLLIFAYMRLPSASVPISGDPIDNTANNFVSNGDLVRLGDKIYFNYYKNNLCYGLVEISERGTRRIYWENEKWLGSDTFNHPIRKYNDSLFMEIEGETYKFVPESNSFEQADCIEGIGTINFQQCHDQVVYLIEDSQFNNNDLLYAYDGENTRKIFEADKLFYYVHGDSVFCLEIVLAEGRWETRIWEYNLVHDTQTLVLELPEEYYNIIGFYVENEHIIFSATVMQSNQEETPHDGVYKIPIQGESKSVATVISSTENVNLLNVYNGSVYVSTTDGLFSINVTTGEKSLLTERYAWDCYIVDDQWVYYTNDMHSVLYRVSHDGTVEEKVYG